MRTVTTMLAALLLAMAGAPAAGAQEAPEAPRQGRGWIGFSYGDAGARQGWIVVQDVVAGSPAERAGLQAGDTIVAWNGRTDVREAVGSRRVRPGESLRLRVRRGEGRERELAVTAGERPREIVTRRRVAPGDEVIVIRPDAMVEALRLRGDSLRLHLDGMALHADSMHQRLRVMLRDSLGPRLKELERLRLPEFQFRVREGTEVAPGTFLFDLDMGARSVAGAEFTEMNEGLSEYFSGAERGVVVLRVAPETPAARAGLRAGDVVVEADGSRVESVRDLRRAVSRADDRAVELEVVRKGRRQTLRMRWE